MSLNTVFTAISAIALVVIATVLVLVFLNNWSVSFSFPTGSGGVYVVASNNPASCIYELDRIYVRLCINGGECRSVKLFFTCGLTGCICGLNITR